MTWYPESGSVTQSRGLLPRLTTPVFGNRYRYLASESMKCVPQPATDFATRTQAAFTVGSTTLPLVVSVDRVAGQGYSERIRALRRRPSRRRTGRRRAKAAGLDLSSLVFRRRPQLLSRFDPHRVPSTPAAATVSLRPTPTIVGVLEPLRRRPYDRSGNAGRDNRPRPFLLLRLPTAALVGGGKGVVVGAKG